MYLTQNNFNGGTVSPWIDSRNDVARHANSLRECKNFICTPYGGVRRRMGTEFVSLAGGKCRLSSFQLSSTKGFILEFGQNYLRFHRNGSRVGTLVKTTPWTDTEVFELQFVKLNRLMIITHRNHAPQRLQYIDDLNWSLTPVVFDYPTLKDTVIDGRKLLVTPDSQQTSTTVVDYSALAPGLADGAAVPESSGVAPVAGAWDVNVASLAFTPSVTSYLKLQRSTDSGATWTDVQSFNAAGNFSGVVAGGLLRLTSLEATVTATLSSDSDADALGFGDTVVITATGGNVFESGHIGSEFEISHTPDETEERLPLGASGTSPWIDVQGTWRLFTSGTWRGKVILERSNDSGATVERVLARSGVADRNLVEDGEEHEKVLMRVRYESTGASDNNPHATLETDGSDISGRVLITAVTSATEAVGTVTAGVYSSDATEYWREPAWSVFAGFPAAITWHESRLWFGGTRDDPSTLWASRSDDFFNFREGTDDDNAFHRIMATTELTEILWLASQSSLYIGTTGEEWRGTSDSDSGVITPGSFILRRVSNSGSEPVTPVLAGSSLIHVQRQGRSLFQIGYDATSASVDGYAPTDLNQIAPHVTLGGIKSIAYQTIRDKVIWAVTGEGTLIGLTYDLQQKISGWHEHVTFGCFGSVATTYEGGNEDSVYVAVEREDVWMIERMHPDQYDIIENQNMINGVFSDSAVIYDGAETTNIGGLNHLEGLEVQVVSDGVRKPNAVVAVGEITLAEPASHCVVGLAFESIIETLPITFGANDGGSSGRYKRISEALLRVYRSVGCQVACNASGTFKWENMRQDWRNWVDTDTAPPSGGQGGLEDWKIPLASGHARDARVAVRITEPFPLNILSLTAQFEFNG